MSLAFEVQNDINQVLQQPRSGDRAILGHVADDHTCHVQCLCRADQCRGDFADLGDPAGCPFSGGGGDGLYRVDDQKFGTNFVDVGEQSLQVGLRGDPQIGVYRSRPPGTQPDLSR